MLGFVRRHRTLTALAGVVLLVLAATAGWFAYLTWQLANVPRFDAGLDRTNRPPREPTEAVNLLLLGSDDPDGPRRGPTLEEVLAGEEWQVGAFRSDTTMVLHIAADRRSAQVIGLPRDSWVPIPGRGRDKLNAAFSYGGPQLTARTVEALTGVHLDHVVVVEFAGFVEITEVIDGVEVYVPETVYDPKQDKLWTRGTHLIEGRDALKYVRQRYGLPGGDFDRIQRQQNFLRAVLDKVASARTLANPWRVTRLTRRLADLLVVDEGFSAGEMRNLALTSRRLRSDDIRFVTAPYDGIVRSPSGASVVELDLAATRSMFAAVEQDRLDAWLARHRVDELPPQAEVD